MARPAGSAGSSGGGRGGSPASRQQHPDCRRLDRGASRRRRAQYGSQGYLRAHTPGLRRSTPRGVELELSERPRHGNVDPLWTRLLSGCSGPAYLAAGGAGDHPLTGLVHRHGIQPPLSGRSLCQRRGRRTDCRRRLGGRVRFGARSDPSKVFRFDGARLGYVGDQTCSLRPPDWRAAREWQRMPPVRRDRRVWQDAFRTRCAAPSFDPPIVQTP